MRWLPVTFLARADVALSVTLTTISTLLAPILTPALTLPLVERSKDVSAADLFLDVFKIVAAPVALGVVLNRYLPGPTRTYTPLLPLVSVTAIALIVVAVVAVNRESLYTSGLLVAVAVFAHNGTCLALGYGIARLLRFERFSLGCSAQASARASVRSVGAEVPAPRRCEKHSRRRATAYHRHRGRHADFWTRRGAGTSALRSGHRPPWRALQRVA